ncbi:MAG: lytic transglycosylase domain-containing protein [Acidimicrobiia bacterium]
MSQIAQTRLPARALRFTIVIITVLLAALVWRPTPARAEEDVCLTAVQRLADWGARESRNGLTVPMLDDLHSLTLVIDTCFGMPPESSLNPWDASPEYRGMGSDPDEWRPLVAVYFDPAEVERAVCLMARESGGNPEAVNGSTGATGLMQVMPFWAGHYGYTVGDLVNPSINLWIASQIRDKQGWSAWSPYLRGSCH